MMLHFYNKVEQFVLECHHTVGSVKMEPHKVASIDHLKRTVHWLKQLKPNADEALLIAGISHDIERALLTEPEYKARALKVLGINNTELLREHQHSSARIVAEFLEGQNAPREMIDRVRMLISKHEEGGDDDQNLLKDADSLSCFEVSTVYFSTYVLSQVGAERVRGKFDWMYRRITLEEAKRTAKPWYEKALRDLEKLEKSEGLGQQKMVHD